MSKTDPRMLDKRTEYYWQNCVPFGSTLQISDPQSIAEVAKHKVANPYLTYGVTQIRRITDADRMYELLLFKLECRDYLDTVLLLTKCSDGQVDVRLYFPVDLGGIPTRKDLADSFLFDDPRNNELTPLLKLQYTDSLKKDGREFRWKQPGERQALCRYIPQQAGLDRELIATFKEYATEDQFEPNPELFLIETGAAGNENGGVVELYQGCAIDPECDIAVF